VTGASERPRPFLTVKEAARELRLDESTLYRHLREDRFAVIEALATDALAAGRCIEVDEWAIRRRDERAAAALAASDAEGRHDRRNHR
jgi:predicted DNA-binding transcriptional regulator AlpA